MATLHFTDGTAVPNLPVSLAAQVVGLDVDGDLLMPLGEWAPDDLCPLTPCCHATGKGAGYSATGVVCRGCYGDVGGKYGGTSALAVAVLR